VWRFALRLTGDRDQAEDLTQETLLRAWRHRRRLRDPDRARVWLFKIAANLWRDRVRRARRRPDPTTTSADELPSSNVPPDKQLIDREDVQRTVDAMDGLPPRQREVLYLYACEELSLAEIADVLDISSNAVKASLSLARKRMRRQLEDLCPDHSPTG
jgi:RNA polymerase sigma-70 factor (ECF subfamily)